MSYLDMPEPPLCLAAEKDPPYIGVCEQCGYQVYVGELYYSTMTGELYHKDCLDDLSVKQWIKIAGLTEQTA